MTHRRLTGAAALVGLSLALGGCVAAAIPLVASGALAGREVLPKDDGERDAVPALAAPPFAGPAPSARPADDESPSDGPVSPVALQVAPATVAEPEDTAGLMPSPPAALPLSATAPARDYTAFRDFALAQATLDPVESPRSSAVLATPGSLVPKTTECTILPPAVLVDIDPGDAPAALGAVPADPALGEVLQGLRERDVAVYWISGASAGNAGELRARLRETGLDPWARDGLLLMRRPDDRKQIRRRELAETHCVVAILGDRRSDFDELFAYLKDPSAAKELDALVGKGWFLTTDTPPTKDD